MTEIEIKEKAEEIAAKYKSMSFPTSPKKHSINDWTEELCRFLSPIDEPYETQVRKEFLSLVGLNGDPNKASYKFSQDFPG